MKMIRCPEQGDRIVMCNGKDARVVVHEQGDNVPVLLNYVSGGEWQVMCVQGEKILYDREIEWDDERKVWAQIWE